MEDDSLKKQPKMEDIILNGHNKEEFPPAHTAEHLLNQTMDRMFGCGRSCNAHIERKKSKMTFILDHKPTRKEEQEIERRMNELIADDLPVRFEYVDRDHLPADVMPPTPSGWCVSLTMTCVLVSASMCAPRRR